MANRDEEPEVTGAVTDDDSVTAPPPAEVENTERADLRRLHENVQHGTVTERARRAEQQPEG